MKKVAMLIGIIGIALLQGCAITKSEVQNFLRPMEFAPVVGGAASIANAAITLSSPIRGAGKSMKSNANAESVDPYAYVPIPGDEMQTFQNISSAN
ncbi:hypothetical protein RW64_16860 [Geobacter sulfurreducens]|nr:hypothetical protein RW64_16860 [Geobacter sulfurreducens]